jgi:hypothetical protein
VDELAIATVPAMIAVVTVPPIVIVFMTIATTTVSATTEFVTDAVKTATF